MHPAAAGLCGLIRAFARPGTTVEGVADLAIAADLICATPEGFELVVLGDAIGRREASEFVERVRGAGYLQPVARPTAAELAGGLFSSITPHPTRSPSESFSTNIPV